MESIIGWQKNGAVENSCRKFPEGLYKGSGNMQNTAGQRLRAVDEDSRSVLDCHGLGRGWKKVFGILSEGKEGE